MLAATGRLPARDNMVPMTVISSLSATNNVQRDGVDKTMLCQRAETAVNTLMMSGEGGYSSSTSSSEDKPYACEKSKGGHANLNIRVRISGGSE